MISKRYSPPHGAGLELATQLRVRLRVLAVMVLGFGLLVTACGESDVADDSSLLPWDPAREFGVPQYAVRLSIVDEVDTPVDDIGDRVALEGLVTEIVWTAGEAWTLGEKLPVVEPHVGDRLTVVTESNWRVEPGIEAIVFVRVVPSTSVDLNWAAFALTPDWLPVDGTDDRFTLSIEAAAQSPSSASVRRTAVLSLVAEGVAFIDARNGPAVAVVNEGSALAAARAAVGFPRYDDSADTALADWLATPAEARALSDQLVDIPAGADQALETEWVWHEAMLVRMGSLASYKWVAMRFPGIGVLGPFRAPSGEPAVLIFGFGPSGGVVEIVGWLDEPPDPQSAVVIASTTDLAFNAAGNEALPIVVAESEAGDLSLGQIDRLAYEQLVLEQGSPGHTADQ